MANEAKQFTIGGVTHDVMDVGARQAIASLQNAIDAITSGDTTTAIKTFQEVIDFLNGITDDATLIGKLNELRTLIAAKYSKPASGISKTDLADDVQTSLGLADTALQEADKTQLQNAINSLQSALDTLIGSGNVQGAIDTFNEVVAFLNGINSSDTLAAKLTTLVPQTRTINGKPLSSNVTIGMSDIQGLETAIGEAGKVKSVSVNGGTAQTPDGNGNVNVSVPTMTLDDAPTAGSNNPVKSGGVKTALDAKANAADVPTKTEMSDAIDDALGEAQVTVVPAGSIGVIDSLGSDSTTDALSANMGKRFKAALLILMGSIGNYAFPNGRPNLPLDGSASVTFNVSYISNPNVSYGSNPPTEVELLGRLEVSISVVSNLYIMDVDNMKVYMGGVPQEDVYNAATGKITINQVVGDVVIVPALMSYVDADGVGEKLAFMLDCKNGLTLDGNGVPTKWEDTIGGIEFDLSNVTIGSDGALVFNGNNAKGISASAGLSVGYNNATIEAVIEMQTSSIDATKRYPILGNTLDASAGARFGTSTSGYGFMGCSTNYGNMSQIGGRWDTAFFFDKTNKTFASTRTDVVVDGYEVLNPRKKPSGEGEYDVNDYLSGKSLVFGVGYAQFSNSEQFFLGKILAIRVYRTQLTVDEMKYNHEIDKKRFNLK